MKWEYRAYTDKRTGKTLYKLIEKGTQAVIIIGLTQDQADTLVYYHNDAIKTLAAINLQEG